MTGPTSGRVTEYYFIVPDGGDAHVLLVPENGRWTLPHAPADSRHAWHETAHVNRAANKALGLRATTRRCACADMDPGSPVEERVYVVENHASTWTLPVTARWIDAHDVTGLQMATPGVTRVLEEWFSWVHAADTSLRPPWYAAGWMNAAGGWIVEQLAHMDVKPAGPIEQVRSWQKSCVLRLPTTRGNAYFKAVPAVLGTEVSVSVLLDHEYPGMVPEVMAADHERRWLLMRDMGSATLDGVPDGERWREAVRAYSQLQVGMVDQTRRFAVAGCPNRGLLQLVESIDRLLADTVAMKPGDPSGLTVKEIHALHMRARALKIAAHRLGTLRLPVSVDHGDFWAGQIVVGDANPVFIDWSDACLSHPFFSMAFFADEESMRPYLPSAADARDSLRDTYLEPWTVYEPHDVLTQAWTIACALAPLSAALKYHDRILPGVENRWELENMVPYYLRGVLRQQSEALPTLGLTDFGDQPEEVEPVFETARRSEGAAGIESRLQSRKLGGPH